MILTSFAVLAIRIFLHGIAGNYNSVEYRLTDGGHVWAAITNRRSIGSDDRKPTDNRGLYTIFYRI